MNNRFSVERIFYDLEKAFDYVNHGIVVDKLESSGISGKFETLIQPYLRSRYQNVLIGTLKSYDSVILGGKDINGVPRGLILGSLFLLIYFNDVHKITDNDAKVVLFADDINIIVTTSIQEGV
jgi:hypothetical protein